MGLARQRLGIHDDGELVARYLGEFASTADFARGMFQLDCPHVDLNAWPYTHIDWTAAAALIQPSVGDTVLTVEGHWFDALPQAPIVP